MKQCKNHGICGVGRRKGCPHQGKHDCDEPEGYCSLTHQVTECRKVIDESPGYEPEGETIEEKEIREATDDFWLEADDELNFDDDEQAPGEDDDPDFDSDDWDI